MDRTNNIVRLDSHPVELRGGAGSKVKLVGVMAPLNRWTEIASVREGRFMESMGPSSFNRTLSNPKRPVRCLYEHGHDPSIGNKPIGVPRSITVDSDAVRYEVDLFDTAYVRELLPAIEAGQMGSSWRMTVRDDTWVEPRSATETNPNRLPERTITDIELHEFGPVTFPAYVDTSAGLRSLTDQFFAGLADPLAAARLTERVGPKVAERIIRALTMDDQGSDAAHASSQPDGLGLVGRPVGDLLSILHAHRKG